MKNYTHVKLIGCFSIIHCTKYLRKKGIIKILVCSSVIDINQMDEIFFAIPITSSYNTRHKSLKQKAFVLNFLRISYIHSSHLCSQSNAPLSFPNVEPRVFSSTQMTANPKSTLGRGKSHKCFKICDEYCLCVSRASTGNGTYEG